MHENLPIRQPGMLPRALLYSIGAGIGGSGLDAVALESLKASHAEGFLKKAIALGSNQTAIPETLISTLEFHPVKALSFLPRPNYVGAKKQAVDRRAAKELRSGRYDFFHGWSGDCLQSLREANCQGIPSLLEIPTWHRNKGKVKPALTKSERERDAAPFPQSVFNRMLVTRQQVLEEYDLATRILVLSQKARETFLAVGVPEEKLFLMHRGVDPKKFTPAERPPEKFRAIFVGALLKRKGIPLLLEAWRKAELPDAELVLVGSAQPEVRDTLKTFAHPSIRLTGHVATVSAELRQASLHVFPSELEGSAKATYEAAACGLPQITTREAGDVVVDGETGWLIRPGDLDALVETLRTAHANRDLLCRMGLAARERILNHFTWDHFRARLLEAYRTVV
jgi:glycosyltransferase involved in cell wall biosynthesis